MNETWAQVLLGLCCTAIFGIVGGGTICVVIGNGRLSRNEASIEFLVDAVGRMAAKKLHSPTDHLEIDKYLDAYIKNHCDMSIVEWDEFRDICISTKDNTKASKEEKAYAEFLAKLCEHKISVCGPYFRRATVV